MCRARRRRLSGDRFLIDLLDQTRVHGWIAVVASGKGRNAVFRPVHEIRIAGVFQPTAVDLATGGITLDPVAIRLGYGVAMEEIGGAKKQIDRVLSRIGQRADIAQTRKYSVDQVFADERSKEDMRNRKLLDRLS